MSSRVTCPMCTKDYADRKGLKKHLIGVHQSKFDVGTNSIRKLEGEELNNAIRTLRRMQSHRKIPVHRGLSPPASNEHSSRNHLVQALDVVRPECDPQGIPLLEPAVPLNLSTAQCEFPDTLSVHTEDLDPAILDLSFEREASAAASCVSLSPVSSLSGTVSYALSRSSTPVLQPSPRASSSAAQVDLFEPPGPIGPPAQYDVGPSSPVQVGPAVASTSYDLAGMAACSGVLLLQHPREPVSSFAHELFTKCNPNMTVPELACATHVLSGVEAGQRQIANRIVMAIDSADITDFSEFLRVINNIREHLDEVRSRPLHADVVPVSPSVISDTESDSAVYYSDISQ